MTAKNKLSARSVIRTAFASLAVGAMLGLGGGVALADASSLNVCYYDDGNFGGHGYRMQAYTTNSSGSPYRGGGIQNWSVGSTCPSGGSVTQPLRTVGWLKKNNGASCVTNGLSNLTGTYMNKLAGYNSTACGTGSLQGGGTAYGYNGTGYTSGTANAPFQTF